MSLAPTSNIGKVIVQPAYFTSSCYFQTMKSDIDALVKTFESEYAESEEKNKPFTLFKTVWCTIGWQWLHFKVFDARSRDMFLRVTCRLFIEHAVTAAEPMARLVALFSLYTFLNTQPSGAPALHTIEQVAISCDQYNLLISLSDSFESSFRAAAINIIRLLINRNAFYIIPDSSLGSQYPRVLPREVLVQDTPETAAEVPKKKGRPSKADKVQKAQIAVDKLDRWLQQTSAPVVSVEGQSTTHKLLLEDPTEELERYRIFKSNFLDTMEQSPYGETLITEANKQVYMRLQKAVEMNGGEEAISEGDRPGLSRVERAIVQADSRKGNGPRGGLLGLVEGAGSN